MIGLCAASSALITAGILVDGALGMLLLALGLAANFTWLGLTFVKWWRLASYRTRLIVFASTVAYVVAWFVIRVAAGPLAAWVLGMGFVGYVAVVTGALATTGYLAAHHAKTTQHAIATGRLKEIIR
jgi:hypothetical protein